MKYLLAVLTAAVLLVGCSSNSDNTERVILSDAADETEASTESDLTEDESNSDTDTEEDSTEADTDDDEATETDGDEDTEGDDDEQSDTAGIEQKNVKLVVEDQMTVGQITVKQLATSRDGWVSVHKSQEGGGIQLPDSIGEARVDSGDSEDVIIDLWEAPDIDEKLWVLLHIDAGERGTYEFPGKDQPVRKNGETMARSFVIQDPNPEEEEDEESAE